MKILFLQTGGSIDKDYQTGEDNDGYSFVITSPAYERILGYVRPGFEYEAHGSTKRQLGYYRKRQGEDPPSLQG